MTLVHDPEVLAAMLAAPPPPDPTPPPVGDIATRRRNATANFDMIGAAYPAVAGVTVERDVLVTADGAELALLWYQPDVTESAGGAALYLHGGGMILDLEHTGRGYDAVVRSYVAHSKVPMLMVDYRAAPEHPHPTPAEDCYAALEWLAERAGQLGVDPARLAVVGDSAGGALAAAVALMARDRGGPSLALQLLVYPMLDDRTTVPDPQIPVEGMVWTYDDNVTGWGALLGDRAGGPDVPSYAAPARETDSADSRPPTSTPAIWTSSGPRSSDTPRGWRRPAWPPNSTSIPGARMDSKCWPPPRRCLGTRSTTGCGDCRRCATTPPPSDAATARPACPFVGSWACRMRTAMFSLVTPFSGCSGPVAWARSTWPGIRGSRDSTR